MSLRRDEMDFPTDIAEIKRRLGSAAERLAPAELEWLVREWRAIVARQRILAEVPTEEWDFEAVIQPHRER
jgi:hypothetical protein